MQTVILDIVLLINRVAMGLFFLLAGVGKCQNIEAFVDGKFTELTPTWLAESIARPYGFALPILEIVFGAALILGVFGRVSAFIMTAMLASFLVALIQANNGDLAAGAQGPFHPNFIFAAIAFSIVLVGPGRISIDGLLFGRKSAKPAESEAPQEPSQPEEPANPDPPQRVI